MNPMGIIVVMARLFRFRGTEAECACKDGTCLGEPGDTRAFVAACGEPLPEAAP